jgi:hypothetical protein
VENAKEHRKGKMMEDHEQLVLDLAKAHTQEVYQKCLALVREANDAWADFLGCHRDEFATYPFLDKGLRRFAGKVTSNSIENVNSALLEHRSMPILCMVDAISKYQHDKYRERKQQSIDWQKQGKLLMEYAEEEEHKYGLEAAKRRVK